jgi:hypothetical protein
MFRHIVMFRFKPETTTEEQDHAIEELRGLQGSIPEIRSLVVSRNQGPGPANYDLVLEADFDDAEGFGRYGPHDSHQRVWKSILQPLVTDLAGIQFNVPAERGR